MKKRFFAFLSLLFFAVILSSCPGGIVNDDVIIPEGTKISDFRGHKNSLDWLIGTFSDDGGVGEKWVTKDKSFECIITPEGMDPNSMVYTIQKIIYNSKSVLTDSYTAPSGSWTFELILDDETCKYIVEKVDDNSFYLTLSTLDKRGAKRQRLS